MKFILALCPSKKNAEALCHRVEKAADNEKILVINFDTCVKKFDYQLYEQYDYILAYGMTSSIDSHALYGNIIKKIEGEYAKAKQFIDLAIFCKQPKGMTLPAKMSFEHLKMKYDYIPVDVETDGASALKYIKGTL